MRNPRSLIWKGKWKIHLSLCYLFITCKIIKRELVAKCKLCIDMILIIVEHLFTHR